MTSATASTITTATIMGCSPRRHPAGRRPSSSGPHRVPREEAGAAVVDGRTPVPREDLVGHAGAERVADQPVAVVAHHPRRPDAIRVPVTHDGDVARLAV